MRIKKRNQNEYLRIEEGLWVRNFRKESVPIIDINTLIPEADYDLLLTNEQHNIKQRLPVLEDSRLSHPNIVIVSDGQDFGQKHQILEKLPDEVVIIGTNGTLAKWNSSRKMDYYVINNPYDESLRYLPRKKTDTTCIASVRTNHKFLQGYRGKKFLYQPAPDKRFSSIHTIKPIINDYRNPVCAAIVLADLFNVENLLLFCCDSSFPEERPASVLLENGLFTYPQQILSQHLIDANLYWLKSSEEVIIKDHSQGIKYNNAEYIEQETVPTFFRGKHG